MHDKVTHTLTCDAVVMPVMFAVCNCKGMKVQDVLPACEHGVGVQLTEKYFCGSGHVNLPEIHSFGLSCKRLGCQPVEIYYAQKKKKRSSQ